MLTGPAIAFATDCPNYSSSSALAFSGATGFGGYADCCDTYDKVSRTVTTLSDYNPFSESPITGSLRKAIADTNTAGGHAIIQFSNTLHGYINLKTTLTLNGCTNVRLNGDGAAAEGITIAGAEFGVQDCHDIVIRYLRFRSAVFPSGVTQTFHCSRSLNIVGSTGLTHDVIVDHCSIGASQDDNLSVSGAVCGITVQYCIIGGGLYDQSKGGIGSGGSGAFDPDSGGGMTYCHNLITNTAARQLSFTGPARIDFYNNVCTNSIFTSALSSPDNGTGPKINVRYNFYRTPNATAYRAFSDPVSSVLYHTGTCSTIPNGCLYVPNSHNTIFLEGNIFERWDGNPDWVEPYNTQWAFTWDTTGSTNADFDTDLQKSSMHTMWAQSDLISNATSSYSDVMDNAGCRLPLSDPELDDCTAGATMLCDQDLVDAVETGNALYPAFNTASADLKPSKVTTPSPSPQASGVSQNLSQLSWTQTDETEYFEVFFGLSTDTTLTKLPGVVAGVGQGQTVSKSLSSLTPLQAGATYKWRIDSWNGGEYEANGNTYRLGCGNHVPGDIWTFTVQQ
jgi:hypothetical protein